MAEDRDYDIVIFGANGVAGKYILWELARHGEGVRWAIAGRSISRLMQTLRNACDVTGRGQIKNISSFILSLFNILIYSYSELSKIYLTLSHRKAMLR